MTLIVGWIAVDSRRVCSAYIVTDSRFSWNNDSYHSYDYGVKLFSMRTYPDVLAYCGDVLFPVVTLTQITHLADSNLLFPPKAGSEERKNIILKELISHFCSYPKEQLHKTVIYHISRDLDMSFHIYRYSLDSKEVEAQEMDCNPKFSGVVFIDGTGKSDFEESYSEYQKGDLCNTSRNVFQCFCQHLKNNTNSTVGGAPQLVGLYNGKKYFGLNYGIIFNNTKYFQGSPVPYIDESNPIRWYNEMFEICSGTTMKRKDKAMKQPNPNI